MRRVEIENAAERIVSALVQTKVPDAIRTLSIASERTKPENLERIIGSLHRFALLAANFGPAEREMMEAMRLAPLMSGENWIKLVTDSRPDSSRALTRAVLYTVEFLPRFVAMIQPDFKRAIIDQRGDLPKVLEGKSLLTVIAIEERRQFSGPQRLIEVMQSVTLMYEAFAIMKDESADGLIVLSCDSGSDKSFDFLGAAKLMEQVKELILSLWDKVVFFREKKAAERIELVAKSLPVIEEIARLRMSGALIPEKAEIVSRKIIEGVEKFLINGATIPEISNFSHFNPRALLSPQAKLLTDVAEPETPPLQENLETEAVLPESGLSLEEQSELRRLVGKLKHSSGESGKGESSQGSDLEE